jgi:uncharacterized protein CbrC (UPF0167 family)
VYECDSCGDITLNAPSAPYTARELLLCAWCVAEYAGDTAALDALRVDVWGVIA